MATSEPRAAVVIAAAGKGARMGAGKNKVFLPLGGRSLLWHSVRAFIRHPRIEQVVVVVGQGERAQAAVDFDDSNKIVQVCTGGVTRQESVFNGLQQVTPTLSLVLIHDGARPLVSQSLIGRVLQAAWIHGAALPGLPVSDSLKRVEQHTVVGEVKREGVFQVQTPQGFQRELLLDALATAQRTGQTFTDDAGAVEHFSGTPPHLVPGEPINLKVTTAFDLELAAYFLSRRQAKGEGFLAQA